MVKHLFLIFFLLFLSTVSAFSAGIVQPVPGLAGQWKVVQDLRAVRTWYDLVGSYNGTLTPTTAASGISSTNRSGASGEMRFDGTTTQQVNLGDVKYLSNASAITYTAWLRQTTLDVKAGIFQKGASSAGCFVAETWDDGFLYVGLCNGASTGAHWDYSTSVTAKKWFHLAIVFNGNGAGNSERLQVYVDGKLQSVTYDGTVPATTANLSGINLTFGRYAAAADDFSWNGAMDDVRLYKKALTAAEVRAVMNDAPSLEQFSVADVTIPVIPTPGGVPNTSVTIPNNLVAQWKGLPNFSSGKFWYNVVAPQHGTLTNGAIFQASGRQGGIQHLFCDGVNDYVNISPPPLTGGKYTIMFWAKDDFSGAFGFNLDMTYTAGRFALSLNGGNWGGVSRGISTFVSGPTYDLSPANALPLNTWSHIAVTLNAATNVSRGFINGNETGTASYTDTFGGAGIIFNFCTRDSASGSFARGLYDDLRIYDAELTAADIRTLYQQSILDTNIMTAAFLPSIAAPQGKGFFNFFGQ